jgi:hypothetical protein
LDVEGAYRTIPVLPDHKRFLVVQFGDQFFIDHNIPFGLASASGLQGEVADATLDIWYSLGIKFIKKWVDDFVLFRFPHHSPFISHKYTYPYDLVLAKRLISPLGIPWHASKGQDFTFNFSYVGLFWDIIHKSVSLTPEKCEKHLAKVTSFIQLASHSQFLKNEVESLNGSLSHVSFVYLRGRSYLRNLIEFIKSFENNFTRRWAPTAVLKDLEWWRIVLTQLDFTRSLIPPPTAVDHGIWVDASTDWGIGILFQGRWDAWRTLPCWKDKGRDIGWLEGVAIELIINILHLSNITDANVLVRSDNQGVIGAFQRGRSRNKMTNEVIQRSEARMDSSNLSISLVYVETSINLADPISRGILPPLSQRIFIPYHIPQAISQYFYHA